MHPSSHTTLSFSIRCFKKCSTLLGDVHRVYTTLHSGRYTVRHTIVPTRKLCAYGLTIAAPRATATLPTQKVNAYGLTAARAACHAATGLLHEHIFPANGESTARRRGGSRRRCGRARGGDSALCARAVCLARKHSGAHVPAAVGGPVCRGAAR
eukprot:99943-Chlamydomonas_euryale.AAC.1